MHIFLIRHGSYNKSIVDPSEGLSALGEKEVLEMAHTLKKLAIPIDHTLSSPKTRAVQTAKILSRELNLENLTVCDALLPSSTPAQAIDHLLTCSGNLLVVGHLPSIHELAETLTGSHVQGFTPATLVHIETSDLALGEGRVLAHFSPH